MSWNSKPLRLSALPFSGAGNNCFESIAHLEESDVSNHSDAARTEIPAVNFKNVFSWRVK